MIFQYFIDCLELIHDKRKDFVVTAHNINYICDEGEMNFNKENILTLEQDLDGNGRVGRLLMFKECLKYNIVPFIIEDNLKLFYYRGLKEWNNEKGYLINTCLMAQDKHW